jgi:hypothetical protein
MTPARRIKDVLGIPSMLATSRDVHLLLLIRFIRMCAYGSSTLVLALYFAALGHSDTRIGLFLSLTLVGDVGISLLNFLEKNFLKIYLRNPSFENKSAKNPNEFQNF